MNPSKMLRLVVCLALIFACIGCSFVERNTVGLLYSDEPAAVEAEPQERAALQNSDLAETNTQPEATEPQVEQARTEEANTNSSNIEVVWEIPEEAVDEYVCCVTAIQKMRWIIWSELVPAR